ncbi:unnamed protein product [Caenorhabditis auriculariae]|uniref:Uncharacterized protein n=1 Tax=Caenorhabditis auriculariae TaxID=2777116 RepID=A0A8S1H1Y1_9PELO|nr:unnamed protein product [Caenorhabditis auriculariae]
MKNCGKPTPLKKAKIAYDCLAFLENDGGAIDRYRKSKRIQIKKDELYPAPMDCESIRKRIIGSGEVDYRLDMSRSIAFARNVFQSYPQQEAFLAFSYHPNNSYCYAIDQKADDFFKNSMFQLSDCLDNVFIVEENDDLILKSPKELSEISEMLGNVSGVSADRMPKTKYESKRNWSPGKISFWKNETGKSEEELRRNLTITKSLNQVFVSRPFIDGIFELVNMEQRYGVDEMLFSTLYTNSWLNLPGQMPPKQSHQSFVRWTHWNYGKRPCFSKKHRHEICVIGVRGTRRVAGSTPPPVFCHFQPTKSERNSISVPSSAWASISQKVPIGSWTGTFFINYFRMTLRGSRSWARSFPKQIKANTS